MILLEFRNIWQLFACNDIMHGTFEIDKKISFCQLYYILIKMLYVQNDIIYLKIVSAFKLNSRPYVVLIHWVWFICWLCLKFRNELYENNIWHWDTQEGGFKMTCTCCFHIVYTGCKQKPLLAHHYEWKISRM